MLDNCCRKRKELDSLIGEIEFLSMENVIEKGIDGEEHIVFYGISEAWGEYLYILNGILYRWDNCYSYLIQIFEEINKFHDINDDEIVICGIPLCDKLSYEFENFLISFPRLNEEPIIMNLARTMSKTKSKQLQDNCFKRNDVDGLFWEINLLRNRFAHSTQGFYSTNSEYAQRFMALSSKIFTIKVKQNKIKLLTTLINLEKNDFIKDIIQNVIIDKKCGEEKSKLPLIELLFSSKPSGKGKNKPQMAFIANLEYFDLNSDFLKLSLKIFEYIKKQLIIIKGEFKK